MFKYSKTIFCAGVVFNKKTILYCIEEIVPTSNCHFIMDFNDYSIISRVLLYLKYKCELHAKTIIIIIIIRHSLYPQKYHNTYNIV